MAALPLMLTPDAQRELDRYLRRVNLALRGHSSVDAEDVERDVRGHIASELAASSRPVDEARLRDVLERLGSPSQWVPLDDFSLWRKVLVGVRSGSQDWWLAFLTFALLVIGLLTAPAGLMLLLASIPMARATLALLEEQGELVGARRWLVYPPLIVSYLAFAGAVFVAPPGLIAVAADPSVRGDAERWFPHPFWVSLPIATAFVAGIWWAVLGLVLTRFTGMVRMLFSPFADWFERRHGIRILRVGLVTAALGTVGFAVLLSTV
jgi:hypothetical protein